MDYLRDTERRLEDAFNNKDLDTAIALIKEIRGKGIDLTIDYELPEALVSSASPQDADHMVKVERVIIDDEGTGTIAASTGSEDPSDKDSPRKSNESVGKNPELLCVYPSEPENSSVSDHSIISFGTNSSISKNSQEPGELSGLPGDRTMHSGNTDQLGQGRISQYDSRTRSNPNSAHSQLSIAGTLDDSREKSEMSCLPELT